MDAWSAGRLLVIDVRVNVLCWFRFSPGKTSFSEWHIQGLQSPCPTHNSGFGAGGKRDRKQQCCRAVAGRTGTEPRVFPGWGTSSKPGWGLVFGIGARHRQLGVTWVSRVSSAVAELPLLLTSERPPAPAHSFPRLRPPGMLSVEKTPRFVLCREGTILSEHWWARPWLPRVFL